jgi:hypothetical protein
MKQTAVEWDALVKKNKMTTRIDVEEFNRNAKEVFENEVVPQIKKAKEDNMTAVEWLEKIRQGQKGQPFDDYEWEIAFNHAKKMEKNQIIDFAYVIADDLACGVFRDKEDMEKRYEEFLTFRSEEE